MKNGKLYKASGITKVLLGLAVAGVLLFASCQDIFDTSAGQPKANNGLGSVTVDLGTAARTTRPSTALADFQYITYQFIKLYPNGDETNVKETWDTSQVSAQQNFYLPEGEYKLVVKAYSKIEKTTGNPADGYYLAATGVYSKDGGNTFPIIAGINTTVYVELKPVEEDAETGVLTVSVKLPDNAKYVFTLEQYLDEELVPTSVTFTDSTATETVNGSSMQVLTVSSTGSSALAAGSYLFKGRINTDDARIGGFSEAVHIVSNLTTAFTRDYVTDPDALAQVKTTADAQAILKDEIITWLTSSETNAAKVFAVVPKQDGEDADTLIINYLGSKMTALIAPTKFPITLQGGWKIATSQWAPATGGAADWNISNTYNSPTAFKLVNDQVKVTPADNTTNPATPAVYNTRYNVILRPVAEYWVSYGTGVDQTNNRGISSFKDKAGADIAFDYPIDPANLTKIRKGISDVGVTAITTANAAITIRELRDGVDTNPESQDIADATGIVTPAFTAASKVYEIKIYQTADDQITAAWTRMRAEIALRPALPTTIAANTPAPPSNTWLAYDASAPYTTRSPYLALSRDTGDKKQVEDAPVANPPKEGKHGTYTISYVYSRLSNAASGASFTINVPKTQDPRWDNATDWVVTYDPVNPATFAGVTKVIGYKPYGGKRVTYNIVLKPVAEFEVEFASTKTAPLVSDPSTSLPASTTKITIKEPGNTAVAVPFEATDISGKQFLLGEQTFALTDATVTIDITTAGAPEVFYKKGYPTTGAIGDNPANDYAAIVQASTAAADSALSVVSRVYKVKVYNSLTKQEDAAVTLFRADSNDSKNWITAAANTIDQLEPFNHVTPLGTDPTTNLIFVGTTPVISLPTAPTSPYSTANGWVDFVNTAPSIAATSGTADVEVKFIPRGGVSKKISTLKVIAAARYNLKFGKQPIGDAPVTGTVTIKATPALGNSQTPVSYTNPATGGGSGDTEKPVLVKTGSANPLLADVSSSNIYGIDFTNTGDAGVTYDASIASSVLQSKTYNITIYPSTSLQNTNVQTELGKITRLVGWTGITSVADGVPEIVTGSNLPSYTTFRVVAPSLVNSTPTPIVVPSTALNTDYAGKLAGGTGADITVTDVAKGIRSDVLTFTPLQAATGTAKQTYTFKWVIVARYNVVFMPGPDKDANRVGNIQILPLVPGTTDLATETIGASHTNNVPLISGIGTPDADNVVISSADGNVFRVGNTGNFTNGASATLAVSAPVISGDYTIEVYPTIDNQKAQALSLLKAVNNNVTFFGARPTPPATDPLLNWTIANGTAAAGETPFSFVNYFGNTVPTVVAKVDLTKILTNTGSSYALEAALGSTAPGTSVQTIPINFTPIGATASAIYNIKLVPVAKYSIFYSDGAIATVTVTPPTTSDPKTAAVFTTTSTDSQYRGLGATNFKVEATAGQYNTVVVSGTTLELNAPTTGTSVAQNFTIADSKEYTIRVIKNK